MLVKRSPNTNTLLLLKYMPDFRIISTEIVPLIIRIPLSTHPLIRPHAHQIFSASLRFFSSFSFGQGIRIFLRDKQKYINQGVDLETQNLWNVYEHLK